MKSLVANAEKLRRFAGRAVEVSPLVARNPGLLVAAAKGVHLGSLVTLDVPWLKALGIGTVLDVGANTGQFARAVRHVLPGAWIYAFEPLPGCFEALSRTMHGDSRFKAFKTAIGNQDGQTVMHQSAASPSSSILAMTETHSTAFPWTTGGSDVNVEIHRLDSFLDQMEIQGKLLLKIDVQGYSLPVLQGAQSLLTMAELVIVETSFVQLYEGEATFDAVYSLMTGSGFRFVGFLDTLSHPGTGETLQGDAMFRKATDPGQTGD